DTLWLKLLSLGDQPLFFLVAPSRHQINGGWSRQVKQKSGSVLRQCPHFCRLAYFSPASSRIARALKDLGLLRFRLMVKRNPRYATQAEWGRGLRTVRKHWELTNSPPRSLLTENKACQMISPAGVRRIGAESVFLSPMKFSTGPTNSMYQRNGFR